MTTCYRIMGRGEAIDVIQHRKLRPVAIVSIAGPGEDPPEEFETYASRYKIPLIGFNFHDEPKHYVDITVPTYEDVAVALAAPLQLPGEILVHCAKGISRSTALAVALCAASQPGRTLTDARRAYHKIHDDIKETQRLGFRGHSAWNPNPRIIWHTDALLGYDGALIAVHQGEFGPIWDDIGQPRGTVSLPLGGA